MVTVVFAFLILMVICLIMEKLFSKLPDTKTSHIKKRPPQIIYPPKRQHKPEIKVFPVKTNKIASQPILNEKVSKPPKQSKNQTATHQNLNYSKPKQKPKSTTATNYIKKVEKYLRTADPQEKTSISDYDEDTYKQAEKLRTDEIERHAIERNKRHFAQIEHEKKLSRKKKSS